MLRHMESLIAGIGVFAGSLLWDTLFGDGIQDDDLFEALTVALVAASIQHLLGKFRRNAAE